MMKKLSFYLLIILFAAACNSGSGEHTEAETEIESPFFGEEFVVEQPKSAGELAGMLSEEKMEEVQITGTVYEVCQSKGCWLTLETDTEETMRVTFKDYGFFVPKDISGKEVVLSGDAWLERTNVTTLRHYAEDAGKSEEEIAAITEDELELYFEASGVLIL